MTTKTTTRLRLSVRGWWILHERPIHNAGVGTMFAVVLLLIHALFRPASAPAAPLVPQVHWPIIVIATAQPLPTATPWPTPPPVIVEVPVEVPVYVPQPVYIAVEAPPTPEPVYAVTSVQPPPAPPEAPANAGLGGSGKMAAPEFAPLVVPQTQTDAERWCAAAASAGKARCVDGEK